MYIEASFEVEWRDTKLGPTVRLAQLVLGPGKQRLSIQVQMDQLGL